MLVQSYYLLYKSTSHLSSNVTLTPSPAVQSPWLSALTLLGVPAVVIFLWISKHALFGGLTLGWTAIAELVLPLGACIFATIVFLVPNPMHALLSLLGVFFMSVLFYLAAGIAFVGLVFLIVYVGAVAVLFLFVIMLLNVKSLTSKDVLVQHMTQWFAIITAAFFFHHLYVRVFTAVSRALVGWNTRVSSLELTSEEAILFYVRYEASDINRLVGLYTVHSPAFFVTTVFLLVSLLGAIILATVTTERATALADIRDYKAATISWLLLLITLYIFIDALVDLLPGILELNLALILDFPYEIFFMSMFTTFTHRNRGVTGVSSLADGAPVFEYSRKYRIVLPQILATAQRGHASLWQRYQFSLKSKKLRRVLVTQRVLDAKAPKKAPKKTPFFRTLYSKLLAYLLGWWLWHRPLVKGSRKGFRPAQNQYRRTRLLYRRQLAVYSAVAAAVKPVTTKWNISSLQSWDLEYDEVVVRYKWLWPWRAERATSLLRSDRIQQDIYEQPEGSEHKQELYSWDWRVYAAKCPLNLFTLGPVGYLRYLCSTKLFPFLYYYAWRGRAFFSIWLFMMFALPLIAIPIPWFLSDYHELWPALEKLHNQVYRFVDQHTLFGPYSRLVKELVVTALLYPAAALNIVFAYPRTFVLMAGLYAYEVVLFTGGDFARAEFHDSKCNHFRIWADRRHWVWGAPSRARALWLYRRHPDKGRTDLSLLVAGSAQVTDSIVEVAPVACPVSPNKVSELLASALDYIRWTPNWVQVLNADLSYGTRLHFTLIFLSLIVAVVFYALCSFFIILNWSHVYPDRSRPSVLPPVILLLTALYLWVCLYFCLRPLHEVLHLNSVHENDLRYYALFFARVAGYALLCYLMFRYEYFKVYKHFAYGNIQRLHSFVNYYMHTWGIIQDSENRDQVKSFTADSIEDVSSGLAAQRVRRKKREKALTDFYLSAFKHVYPTWDKSYHDPEPNPFCRPRRAGSHRYTHSPFKRHRRTFVKRRQARVPMPDKTTFEGMFSPGIIMFTSFYSQYTDIMTYVNYYITPFFFIDLLPLSVFSTPTAWVLKKFLAFQNNCSDLQLVTTGELPTVLSRFETTHVLISFLPEITLAFMITYLIGVVAVELAANRAPKVLAIECWRSACWGLVFVAFLYGVQLLGFIQNAPVASGYLYVSKGLTVSKLFVTLSSLFVLHLSENYIREHTRHVLEFSIIMLLGVLLLLILVSANNLMLVFFSLAGFSLNLYILILYDAADAASREASLKYFYLSTLSAGFILFGILLIYVTVGDVTYYTIRVYMNMAADGSAATVMSAAVLFILVGFFFKLSAFPGHLWAVEVYEGSPLPVMAFFILPVKVAIFITFMRLLNTGLLEFSHVWLPTVTVAALGSLLWGAFAATQERKTTRFLGYASINQIGFLLLGLIADTDDALRSAFFYLILYAIMTGGFLLVFTQLRKENGATFVALSDFRGLGKTENLVCWNLAVFLFSMAGIPPLAGFFGKYYLLSSLMEKGLFAPVVIGLAVSLITAYYYLRIIKTFWFEEDIAVKPTVLLLSAEQRTLLSVLEAALWVAAVFAPWLLPVLTDTIATLAVCADSSASNNQTYPFTLYVDKFLMVDTCDPAGLS